MNEDVRTNYNVHDHLKHLSVAELRDVNQRSRLPFAVCAWNIDGNLNIGMMIRTACNMGAERFIVIGRRHYDKRSCVGSNHYLNIDIVNGYDFHEDTYDSEVFWETMEKYDYTPVLFETTGKSISNGFSLKNFNKNPCLVFGSESRGLPRSLLEDSRAQIYSIPQLGVIRSYNVSAASAIAMWELVRSNWE